MDDSEDDVDGREEYLFKVVVVEDSTVGKSNLLSRVSCASDSPPSISMELWIPTSFLQTVSITTPCPCASQCHFNAYVLRRRKKLSGRLNYHSKPIRITLSLNKDSSERQNVREDSGNIWEDPEFVEVIGIGSRKDAFQSANGEYSFERFRSSATTAKDLWERYLIRWKKIEKRAQLENRKRRRYQSSVEVLIIDLGLVGIRFVVDCMTTCPTAAGGGSVDATPRVVEAPSYLQSSSKAVILLVGAAYGLDHTRALEILKTVKSGNCLIVSIILKPFSFEGRRRQDEETLALKCGPWLNSVFLATWVGLFGGDDFFCLVIPGFDMICRDCTEVSLETVSRTMASFAVSPTFDTSYREYGVIPGKLGNSSEKSNGPSGEYQQSDSRVGHEPRIILVSNKFQVHEISERRQKRTVRLSFSSIPARVLKHRRLEFEDSNPWRLPIPQPSICASGQHKANVPVLFVVAHIWKTLFEEGFLREPLIAELHRGGPEGHYGRDKTLNFVSGRYFLPTIQRNIFTPFMVIIHDELGDAGVETSEVVSRAEIYVGLKAPCDGAKYFDQDIIFMEEVEAVIKSQELRKKVTENKGEEQGDGFEAEALTMLALKTRQDRDEEDGSHSTEKNEEPQEQQYCSARNRSKKEV
ncbi:hypothetical protein RJ639_017541 [Escallonia herrerae]|uniref:Uncharacterized protein n=1 Tax=Escallonia herrerae TaxID=1293975 RepID=A0AA88VCD8_9ASTE|nr:hypothetical protein RJ639_017541 [Escallonia herrerae]